MAQRFVPKLQSAAAKFFDWRHVYVLPYSAQANGTAESSVKRIAALLQRQCADQTNWHRLLPSSQLLLNTTTHTSLGVSPYMALFGREPYGIEVLENPALLPEAEDGDTFLRDVKSRLMHLHAKLKEHSDAI